MSRISQVIGWYRETIHKETISYISNAYRNVIHSLSTIYPIESASVSYDIVFDDEKEFFTKHLPIRVSNNKHWFFSSLHDLIMKLFCFEGLGSNYGCVPFGHKLSHTVGRRAQHRSGVHRSGAKRVDELPNALDRQQRGVEERGAQSRTQLYKSHCIRRRTSSKTTRSKHNPESVIYNCLSL